MPQTIPTTPQRAQDWQGGQKTDLGEQFRARKLNTPLDKITRNCAGKRSTTRTKRKRGRYIKALPSKGRIEDVAFDATLRAAAIHQRARRQQAEAQASDGGGPPAAPRPALYVRRADIHRKVRVRRAANLILFVVDASWSMAVAERMAATKGAIMSLLTDAYQRRDRVGLIVFQKNSATLVLPPTSSVELAQKALRDIPVGGKTPLSAGLTLSLHVTQREKRLHPEVMPLLIVLTDGAGNVSMSNLPPQVEAHRIANQIRDERIRSVVINMEHVAFDQGLARKLAENLNASCLSLRELRAEALYEAVKRELQ
ncbi:MAG: VWA domain-containing protein [Thermoflexales bacterium]|nr:VWA domain-containing protein [Thermoflexales bacterium]MDW8350274.1 VWA domain-containing protein [Anaerolineae bacterium]